MASFIEILKDIRDIKYPDLLVKYSDIVAKHTEIISNISSAVSSAAAALISQTESKKSQESASASASAALLSENKSASSASNALISANSIKTLTATTGESGTEVIYDATANNIQVPKGVAGSNGVDGMTPQYSFIYNVVTGDLEYTLTGYIPSTDISSKEW